MITLQYKLLNNDNQLSAFKFFLSFSLVLHFFKKGGGIQCLIVGEISAPNSIDYCINRNFS